MEIYKKQTLAETFSVYFDRRMIKILLLGAIRGFPWVIIGSSLSLWLKEDGLSRSTIGWAGLIFAVYAFNYLWAPIIDRVKIPWLTNKIGHRRGWIVLMQTIILISLIFWTDLLSNSHFLLSTVGLLKLGYMLLFLLQHLCHIEPRGGKSTTLYQNTLSTL